MWNLVGLQEPLGLFISTCTLLIRYAAHTNRCQMSYLN